MARAAKYLAKRDRVGVCPVYWRPCASAPFDRSPRKCSSTDHRTLFDPVEMDAQLVDQLAEAAKRYHGLPVSDLKGRAAALDEWIAIQTGQPSPDAPEQEGLF